MFPLQRSCELSFLLSDDKDGGDHHSDSNPQQQYLSVSDIPHPDLLGSPNPMIADDRATGGLWMSGRRRRRNSNLCGGSAGDYVDSKRMIHRETERQRRLEMASQFTTLKNLLPQNYVKGKRSMSDHIMEAGNYIKELQRRTKEMEMKRDKLKGTEDPLWAMNVRRGSHVVSVERCSLGLEIKVICGSDDELPLSNLLSLVMQQGLDVVNCVSTQLRKRFIHVIHAEMKDMSSIDPSWLQRRLVNEIC